MLKIQHPKNQEQQQQKQQQHNNKYFLKIAYALHARDQKLFDQKSSYCSPKEIDPGMLKFPTVSKDMKVMTTVVGVT